MKLGQLVGRVLGIIVLSLLISLAIAFVAAVVARMSGVTSAVDFLNMLDKWFPIVSGFSLLVGVFVFAYFLDEIDIFNLIRLKRGWGVELFVGLLLGIVVPLGAFMLSIHLGHVSIRVFVWDNLLSGFLWSLLVLTLGALAEELFFRGYIISHWRGRMWWAILFSSLVFAIMHFPKISSLFSFADILLAGIVLALMYIWSDRLWMPIGFHFAWNMMIPVTTGRSMFHEGIMLLNYYPNAWVSYWWLIDLGALLLGLFVARWFLRLTGKECPLTGELSSTLAHTARDHSVDSERIEE